MRSPDSDETGSGSGGGDSLAEGFGSFMDGSDTDTDDETSFGEGAQGASDTSGLEGVDGAGEPSNPYDVAPDDVPSEDDYDYTGDGQVDGGDFHEALTGLVDFGVDEPDTADADHGAPDHHDHHDHHADDEAAAPLDDGAFDLF